MEDFFMQQQQGNLFDRTLGAFCHAADKFNNGLFPRPEFFPAATRVLQLSAGGRDLKGLKRLNCLCLAFTVIAPAFTGRASELGHQVGTWK
jgi:hypothetical protein